MNITLNNVGLTYGKHRALENINLTLHGEKIIGLLGRNGAGKTSLLSLLASYRKPTTGSITINGEVPFENATVMQQVIFIYSNDYSAETENIKDILAGFQRYRPNFDKDYAEYLIKQFNLDMKKPMKKLSKGMQSAVNAIIGLATRAPITILDEVYLGMDAPSRDIFYKELLQDQQKHPRLFILSTHLVSEMDYLFDEVVILKDGKLLLQEEIDTLISKGATITGAENTVNEFVHGKTVINTQSLGPTKSAMIYGDLSDNERKLALEKGLQISSIPLQDLFIHLTKEEIN